MSIIYITKPSKYIVFHSKKIGHFLHDLSSIDMPQPITKRDRPNIEITWLVVSRLRKFVCFARIWMKLWIFNYLNTMWFTIEATLLHCVRTTHLYVKYLEHHLIKVHHIFTMIWYDLFESKLLWFYFWILSKKTHTNEDIFYIINSWFFLYIFNVWF